jgi:hypothetical protein
MELKILFIEDDEEISQNLFEFYNDLQIDEYIVKAQLTNSFEDGVQMIKNSDFDIVVLDLFKDGEEKDEEAGRKVLSQIRKIVFVPVIFYTGHAYKVTELISEVVGVVNKGDGIEGLSSEIEKIISSKIALIKAKINGHLKELLREYFWETVDAKKDIFTPGENDASLGYLLLRRFGNSLSKENIKKLLGDDKIKEGKTHPMEFYIYPTSLDEYQAGEIILKDGIYYSILTPNCDFIQEKGRPRKVGKVLLAEAIRLKESDYYKKYESNNDKYKQALTELIESRKTDRYFFLPKTPFIENLYLDFQKKRMVEYDELTKFERIAKLDSPFAESMIASFIRYYNRIGFPDIDSEYVIQNM